MQQTQVADATEVFGSAELSLEPKPAMSLRVVEPANAVRVTGPAVTPSDILALAMQAGDQDVARLERLMAMDIQYREMQRDMQEVDRKRDAEMAFESDFVGFKGENVVIPKTKMVERGKAGKFPQAEFDQVCGRLAPALAKHGFGFRHKERFGANPIVIDGEEKLVSWVWVSCILSHRSGHRDTLDLDGPADDQSANTPLQNAQSAASYLKRQSLLALTGTATGGEDDENRPGKPGEGATEGKDPATESPEHEGLQDAGRAAALNGMVALTAWWAALLPAQRELMQPEFGSMRIAARKADGGQS